jgi:hypothetical protein
MKLKALIQAKVFHISGKIDTGLDLVCHILDNTSQILQQDNYSVLSNGFDSGVIRLERKLSNQAGNDWYTTTSALPNRNKATRVNKTHK